MEQPKAPHAEPIRRAIRESAAVFLALSEPMVERPHTRSWVGYEVGIAADLDLPIVVIEPAATAVELPVPGATVYMQRPLRAEQAIGKEWEVLFSTAGRLRPYEWKEAEGKGLGGSILTFLGNAIRSSGDETGAFYSVQCGFEHCRSAFFAPSDLHRYHRHPCPACRRPVEHWNVRAMDFVEKASKDGSSA